MDIKPARNTIAMRYRLRTLLILLAIVPPLMGAAWFEWHKYWEEREKQRLFDELIELITTTRVPESEISATTRTNGKCFASRSES